MPFTDDPVWIDGLTYSGAEMRRVEAMSLMTNGSAAGSLGGVRPGDPGLLASLAGMSISVAAGVAAIAYPGQGVYRTFSPTTWTGTVSTAHASLTRIDLVYLRVWDGAVDASGLTQGDVVYLAGTPGSGTAPTPSGTQVYITLAAITVPAGSTTPTVQDLRPYAVAPGGIAPGGAVSGYYAGQYRDNPATGALERYTGTGWVPYSQFLTARKTADQQVSASTAFQTDSQLTVPLAANAAYAVDAFIIYSTPDNAEFKAQWAAPSGATMLWSPWALSGGTSDTGGIRAAVGSGGWTVTSTLPSTTNVAGRPVGTITTTTAGSLTYQWGQSVSDAAATTVRAGSWLRAHRIA
ncbi:hypothetical protein [Actinacidiphila sp. ITFR-21]|uniref:hypothetical protein n=1 Tax=Actinacidiphila sp. ITFR-21 TaxID=3075199 RepID=UPI00288C02C9|nr:hypothetical protein [Streptomyces sp. ITFR-21]WNI16903.1 hypothetical protein RLT57_16165 [Streptomyces sp. ITFR-21]